jgi:chromosome segregation ATPase
MEKTLDMVNQKVQDALKRFQDTTNNRLEKTQKQLNKLREDFNRHQSEKKKDRIKREIYELKRTTQNIKEELNKDMENLRKKNQTEILEIKSPFSQIENIAEGHYSRLEQVEDRISELKDKIEIEGKKMKKSWSNNTRAVKGICKNSATPSKDQT